MTTLNFNPWSYELTRDRHQELLQVAAQQRQLQALRPVAKRSWRRLQPLALLRTWRLVPPRLQWASPVDEAPCS